MDNISGYEPEDLGVRLPPLSLVSNGRFCADLFRAKGDRYLMQLMKYHRCKKRIGEMAEWSKARSWNDRSGNTDGGSTPSLSAFSVNSYQRTVTSFDN